MTRTEDFKFEKHYSRLSEFHRVENHNFRRLKMHRMFVRRRGLDFWKEQN
jgi:hypothetical protein